MRLIILVGLVMVVLVGGLTAALVSPDDPLTGRTVDAQNLSNATEPQPAGSIPLSAGRLVRADIVIE